MTSDPETPDLDPREKVRTFPTTPGVYLMKDAKGRVILPSKYRDQLSDGAYVTKGRGGCRDFSLSAGKSFRAFAK